jgi:hypothetical protein
VSELSLGLGVMRGGRVDFVQISDEGTRTAGLLISSALFNRRRYGPAPTRLPSLYAFDNIILRRPSSVREARKPN